MSVVAVPHSSTGELLPPAKRQPLRAPLGSRQDFAVGAFLLAVVVLSFGPALSYVPSDSDMLNYFTIVERARSPLDFFASDARIAPNRDSSEYRPLNATLIWASYKLFGVWVVPGQVLNLGLHLLNGLLLYAILLQLGVDRLVSGAVAGIALASRYAVSAASWISDRDSLLVAGCVLLLLAACLRRERPLRVGVVTLLSVVALCSKESGVLIPGVALLWTWYTHAANRVRMTIACTGVLLGYMALRAILFGPSLLSYPSEGFLLATVPYDDLSQLDGHWRWVARAENAGKNFLGAFFPLFNNKGGYNFALPGALNHRAVAMAAQFALGALALYRLWRGDRVSHLALFTLVGFAGIHFVQYRDRYLYLPQFIVCLLVGSLFVTAHPRSWRVALRPTALAFMLAAGVLVSYRVHANAGLVDSNVRQSRRELTKERLEQFASPTVRRQMLLTYGAPAPDPQPQVADPSKRR